MTMSTQPERTGRCRALALALVAVFVTVAHAEAQTAASFDELPLVLRQGDRAAQDVAGSFDELLQAGSLRPGDGVFVTDTTGRRLKGTVSDLSSTALVATHEGEAWTAAAADLHRVERQDTLANGIAYGVLIATGSLVGLCVANGGSRCGHFLYYMPYVPILGGVVGLVVDAHRHKTIYRAAGSTRVAVVPMVSHERLGAQVSVGW